MVVGVFKVEKNEECGVSFCSQFFFGRIIYWGSKEKEYVIFEIQHRLSRKMRMSDKRPVQTHNVA